MMKASLTGWVALIVIFGHLLVFFVGLLLGVFRLMTGADALQTLLMASPILASTAFAALSHILTRENHNGDRRKEDPFVVLLCIAIPILLLAAIFLIFILFYIQIDGFGPDQLKIALGALEATFGAFLGAISKRLFGTDTSKSTEERTAQPG